MSLTEAALLHEVARVQHDKTIQAVRDLMDSIQVSDYDTRSYSQKPRSATQYRDALLAGIQRLREETQ